MGIYNQRIINPHVLTTQLKKMEKLEGLCTLIYKFSVSESKRENCK